MNLSFEEWWLDGPNGEYIGYTGNRIGWNKKQCRLAWDAALAQQAQCPMCAEGGNPPGEVCRNVWHDEQRWAQQAQPWEECSKCGMGTHHEAHEQQAQPEQCLDHDLRIQRLTEANTLLKQAQSEQITEWSRTLPPLEFRERVLALFAPKETA